MCPDIILNKTVTKLPESGSEISHISLSQMSRKIPIETQASRQKTDCARTKAVFLKPAKMRLTDFVHSKRAVQSDSIKTDVPVQKTSSQRTDLVKTKPIALALKQDGKRNAVAVSSRKAEESNQIRIEGLRPERSRIKTDPVKSKSKLTVPKKIEKKKTVLLCSKAALPRSPNSATTSTSCCRTDSSVNFVSSDKCGISEVLNENKRQSGSHANFVSCPSATVTGSQRTHSSTEEDKTMGRILRERKPKSSSLGVVHPGNGHAVVKKVGKSKPVGQTKLVKKTEGGNGLLEMKHQEYAELEAITEMKKEVSRPTDLTVKKEKKVKQQKSNPGKGVSQKSSTHTGPSDCENKCSGEIQSLEGNEETLMFVGAHCSIAGGVSNAVKEAKSLGAKAFGLFVRNGRTWKLNALNESESERFKAACKEHGYSPHLILPHGSYLLNCGSSNPDTLKKSRDTLVHELQICEKLGLTLYNFHPGSACGQGTVDQCIDTIGKSINLAHSKTKFVKTVIENMSCQGQTVGGRFEELKAIIDRVKDKTRVGVCLDTCHAFAAGFDLSSEEGYTKMMNDFEEKIGLKYLSAAHLNDSKGELGCHLDRHENIGKGRIGMDGFRRVMNDPRFRNIPMILETPVGDYAKEIQTLYQLTK